MHFKLFYIAVLFFMPFVFSQKTIDGTLAKFNTQSVPYISVNELKNHNQSFLLDTRKKEEFNVSHLSQAHWVGYETFNIAAVEQLIPDKNSSIVVYCSIGVRSEDIGEKLKKAGYSNVKNLYGGIFQWKADGELVFDPSGNSTEKVHAFSKQWGKLLTNAQKIYSIKPE